MVASSHRLVSEIGARVLADGGTAGDAALAMAAACFVTLPAMCGVGGDAFCVWYDAGSERYGAVQGSGVGPDGADAEYFASRGLQAVPETGPLSVSVPGGLAAIETLHRQLATRSLADLWQPAADLARDGVAVTARLRGDIEAAVDKLAANEAARAIFLPGGDVPALGAVLRQPDLATTIERLADSPGDLYHGDIARRCLETLRAAGAPYSGREWEETAAPVTATVTGTYRGHVVHESPLPSQGYMLLQQAAVLDGVMADLPWLSGQALAWFAGAAAVAFDDRRRLVGSDSDAWRELLRPDAVSRARSAIAAGSPLAAAGGGDAGDTTSLVAVDSAGNAVSFIHSLAYTFGSGFAVPGTGVVLNDRLGRGAYLDPHHPNGVRPGRRPMHTLNAWIVAGPTGRPVLVGGTPGGDGQVQWNMQVLSHLLDHHIGPQRAVEAPRLTVFPGSDAGSIGSALEVRAEARFSQDALEDLRVRGLPVSLQGPWHGGGSAQVVEIDPVTGERRGGSDPRYDGIAIGG
jgi:gamma-glutamyltranspeptidase/glutathione hydrolase